MADLTAYVPRLLLEWEPRFGTSRHAAIDGTLVFADVSGFTKLSEALARKSGKAGAEEMAVIINELFGELLHLAAVRGGEMLKYGGDAMLLFFDGEGHARRAAAACADMQARLRQIGRVDTGGAGVVRLRMSVGGHSGTFDFFVAGRLHRELIVAGPATSITVAMESAADATEILMSRAWAGQLPERHLGAERDGGVLLKGTPQADLIKPSPLQPGLDASGFVCDLLGKHLSAGGAEPEHRLAVVSFLQFLELDRLLKAGAPDEAARRVDDVLSLVQEAYERYEVAFLATDLAADGGKVMAAAGVPCAHEDDEERMLRASRDILDADPALPVRIGVNRGHVFAGDVGPPYRRTYTTLGDVTNTAARVMGRARGGEVLALEPVLRASASEWAALEQEPFMAKGKSEPLVPWRVEARGGRRVRASSTPLVGRDVELAALVGELKASVEQVRAAEVVGGPGFGKSRLLGELRARAQGEGRHVFELVCDPFTEAVPYRGVSVVASAAFGPIDESHLRQTVAAVAPALADELPLVGVALGLELPHTATTAALDEAVLPERIAAAVGRLLAACMPPKAVLLAEDVHWLDAPSASCFEAMRASRVESGLLVCATRREADGGWHLTEPDAAVELQPLDADQVSALVRSVASRPLMPAEIKAVVARAAGNPLFAEQLAQAPMGDVLPDSLEDLVATSIDRLPPEDRDLLRRLAVLGPAFSASLMEAVDVPALTGPLFDYLVAGAGEIRFNHSLLQETAYAGLTYRRRRQLHRSVAEHLIAVEHGERVEELSLHCHSAAMWGETWNYARAAAEKAEGSYAFEVAAQHWERAARAGRLAEGVDPEAVAATWHSCGEARRRAGEVDRAEAAFRAGRKLTRAGSAEAVRLAASIGRVLLLVGKIDGAHRWSLKARREMALLDSPPFALEASVDELRADVAWHRGRHREVLSLTGELVSRAEAAGDVVAAARAQALRHVSATNIQAPECREEEARALRLAQAAGNARLLVQVLVNAGDGSVARSEWEEAAEFYRRASDASNRGGFTLGRAVIDNNLAELLVFQGKLDAALPAFERSRTTAAAAGHWHEAYLTANVGWVSGLQGRFAEAEAAFDEAERRLTELGLSAVLPEVLKRRVNVSLVRGDPVVLDRLLAEADVEADAVLLVAVSHCRRWQSDQDAAAQAADRALAMATEVGNLYEELLAREALWRAGVSQPVEVLLDLSERLGIVARTVVP